MIKVHDHIEGPEFLFDQEVADQFEEVVEMFKNMYRRIRLTILEKKNLQIPVDF